MNSVTSILKTVYASSTYEHTREDNHKLPTEKLLFQYYGKPLMEKAKHTSSNFLGIACIDYTVTSRDVKVEK